MSESEVSEAPQETEVPATDPAVQAATEAFMNLRFALNNCTKVDLLEDSDALHKMVRAAGFLSAVFAIERVWVAGGNIASKIPTPGVKGAKRGRKSNAEKAAQEAADAARAYEVSEGVSEGVSEAVEGGEVTEGQTEMEATNNGRGRGRRNS